MPHPSSCAGRILTLFSLVFLIVLSFTVSVHASPSNALRKRDPPPPSDGTPPSGTDFTSSTALASTSTSSQTSTSSSVSESTSTSSTSTAVTTSAITTSETSIQTSSTESDSSFTTSFTSSIVTSSTPISTSTSSSIVSVTPTSSTVQSSGATLEAPESTISDPTSSTTTSVSSSSSHQSSGHSSASSLILTPATTPAITVIPVTESNTKGLSTVFYTSTFAQAAPLSSATASPTQTAVLTASASKGFWSNKGAVAGTFVTIVLVVAAALAGLVFWNIRRRKARYDIDDEAFFGTNEQALQRSDTYGGGSRESADPDLTEKAMAVSQLEDSYPSRDVHYGFEQNNYAAYGLDYPPGFAPPVVDPIQQHEEYNYAGQPQAVSIPEAQYSYAVDHHVQEQQYPAAQDVAYDAYTQRNGLSAQPYAQDMDNTRRSRLAPTIDSFYGADNLTSQA